LTLAGNPTRHFIRAGYFKTEAGKPHMISLFPALRLSRI
jgi:hypothetical protein